MTVRNSVTVLGNANCCSVTRCHGRGPQASRRRHEQRGDSRISRQGDTGAWRGLGCAPQAAGRRVLRTQLLPHRRRQQKRPERLQVRSRGRTLDRLRTCTGELRDEVSCSRALQQVCLLWALNTGPSAVHDLHIIKQTSEVDCPTH